MANVEAAVLIVDNVLGAVPCIKMRHCGRKFKPEYIYTSFQQTETNGLFFSEESKQKENPEGKEKRLD